jgi:hypothetical protein
MAKITVECDSLVWLLSLSQRKQNIGGKVSQQVHSLMIRAVGNRMHSCSLVKDGLSSLTMLSIPCTGDGSFAVSSIENFLGALKYHGGTITINLKPDKVVLKSGNKQTTITSSDKALAFPHTADSIEDWEAKSLKLAGKIHIQDAHLSNNNEDNVKYIMTDGERREPFASWVGLDTTTLYEAFRCDSMNSQKFNLYSITSNDNGLSVGVGKELKGKTTSHININKQAHFGAVFQGGLEHVFANLSSAVGLHFFDFRKEEQGIRMLITLGSGDFIFQASNLG